MIREVKSDQKTILCLQILNSSHDRIIGTITTYHLLLPGLLCLHPLPWLLPLAHLCFTAEKCSDNTLDNKDDKPVVIILLPTATLVLCPIVAVTAVSPITPLGVVAVVPLHITQLIDLKACMKTYVLLTTLILVVP